MGKRQGKSQKRGKSDRVGRSQALRVGAAGNKAGGETVDKGTKGGREDRVSPERE